ncbi:MULTISPECIES: hypothetical protein [unclassified Rhodococcus (in: high G+C Gram-positive bacteria)]|uniref:hypothetical protein n=1 Tax=unclassified Rhodococcus (in: high G+C Gram-positive bacteria) TaxID=192944 RepID=UPI000B9C12B2|nr:MULTISPECIES: hypothetical protein [unclassified Rhodococcus (in: high G+C Gram-positive bacteria)]OZE35435.1 hypothetical protein CH259_15335 [Rhodococcus sp. 05-2254-4]OZE47865.1 hypothetical protein CH261_07930 [Rhodococcus sp. 05-2254-3]OZE49076.1 hypothetical protein CH283_15715 [Rhodococcus sp. 05-2254-2]
MSENRIREPAAARWIVLASFASAAGGLAVAFGWRYGVTRTWIDADSPPPVASGDTGYFRVYDYVQYVSGPPWWPVTWVLPVAALVIGTVVSVAIGWFRLGRKTGRLTLGAAPLVAGSIVGAGAAWWARSQPPEIRDRMVANPYFDDLGPTGAARLDIYGGPPLFDTVHAGQLLPVMGAVIGATVFGVVLAVSKLRARRLP